jgi:Ca2+:H+ antiporter
VLLAPGSPWIFLAAASSLVPLAGVIGLGTEQLARRSGPVWGGFLNATLGNAAELIIALVAFREGHIELVKASITGSILGNLLLVLGLAFYFVPEAARAPARHSSSNRAALPATEWSDGVHPSARARGLRTT